MALKESNMMAIGTQAPSFVLPDTITDKKVSLDNIKAENGFVVYFICNHCPYVINVAHQLVEIADDYQKKGIGFVAISSNDVARYPDDSPENMSKFAMKYNLSFPYLYDESQEVARTYDAACTPDIFVFNNQGALYYQGRIDQSRPGNGIPVTGEDLRAALDQLLSGKPAPEIQYPSAGCSIKWK